MTTPPPESSPAVVAPTLEETRALNNSFTDEEIRSLAQQLLKSGELGFDPTTILKGQITAINLSSSPPTLSIQVSGDTTTTVPNVRMLDSYSPQVGHAVLLAKQGPDIVIIGHIADLSAYSTTGGAGGWVKATLAGGSHNGNSNGDVCYRRVLDYGSWKMQWRGGWSVSGTTIVSGLASEFRPTGRRTLIAARDATGSNDVKIDFNTDGSVSLVGTNTAPSSAAVSGDVGFSSSGGDHAHGFNDLYSDGSLSVVNGTFYSSIGSHDHSFFGGSHSHSVTSPTWVSLNGLEYFL